MTIESESFDREDNSSTNSSNLSPFHVSDIQSTCGKSARIQHVQSNQPFSWERVNI